MWATPAAWDCQGASGGGQGRSLRTDIHDIKQESGAQGQLNADWVELLMGFDIGYTDINCDEPEPWPGWPAPRGADQYPYEPFRTVTGQKNRANRLKCLGNAVVPWQVLPILWAICNAEANP